MEDGRLAMRVERLEQAVEGLRAPAGPTGGVLGADLTTELRWLSAVLLGQDSMADLLIRSALEAGISGTVERRIVREAKVVDAAGTETFRWTPQPARVLRVYGSLNVIAQPHTEQVTVTLSADQSPVPVAQAIPLPADWSLESYLIPSARTDLRLDVTNNSAASVLVVVDTTLVDLEPVFHDDVIRPALVAQFERLRGLFRRA